MANQLEVHQIVEGEVTGVQPYGAFVAIDEGVEGLVHISEITHGFVKDINEHLSIGDKVNVKILNIDEDNNKYSLSIRATMDKSAQESKKQVRKKQTKDNSSSGFNTMKEELEQWLQQSNL
ncbi:MAG TPA: S1 domain-containing post-transcriptional regulator GSP13 [Bacillota bacterium]|nr:S1 domain-containing post-transcriptional regulator GSP13 [Bacillota bacterium]